MFQKPNIFKAMTNTAATHIGNVTAEFSNKDLQRMTYLVEMVLTALRGNVTSSPVPVFHQQGVMDCNGKSLKCSPPPQASLGCDSAFDRPVCFPSDSIASTVGKVSHKNIIDS
jgi:hypothetical protein